MATIPDDAPMENPPQPPLAGLDPADLLKQGVAADTIMDDAPAPFHLPSVEELALLFPQFEILGLIGKGGMGAVYKVRQPELDRIVALKILPPAIGETAGFAERFAREAKALAKLNHPGIVTIHEFGSTSLHQPSTSGHQLFYFLMEFVDGVNLAQLMQTGRISPREALAIVPQICDALQFAHDQGIVHRDIKPENILLDRRGRVKVADFGIAKVVAAVCDRLISDEERRSQTDATLAGKIIGTPQYMAPEQIDHPSEVDHRADIYALGVVFCQMLTGELPGKEMQAPSRKVSIDVRLDEMVLRALEEKPDRRYQTALEFRTVLDGLPSAMPPPTVPERGMFRRWWWMFLVMIPLGMLLGLAAAGVVAYVMPKKYEAEATIEVVSPGGAAMTPSFLGTQFEAIKSRAALSAVAQQLELSNKWMLSEQDVIRVLKGIVKIQNIRGTDLISIRVRHTNKEDVVSIVNAIVMSYQRNFGGKVIIHETPQLPRVPVSPNVTLLLVTGVAVGLLLSPLLALLLILVLHRLFPEKRESVSADKGGSAGKLATALLLLAGFLIVVVSGSIFWWREMRSSEEAFRRLGVDGLRPQMPIRTTDTPPPAIVLDDKQRNQVKELAGSPTFGPVIERVVTDIQQYPAQASLDLGSGDFITTGYLTSRLQDLADRYRVPPWAAVNGSDGNLYRWIKDSGADLVGCTGLWDEPQFKLFGEEPKYMLGDDTFETIQPSGVMKWMGSSAGSSERNPNFPSVPVQTMNLSSKYLRDVDFILFRTHDGDVGVMEILGISENPRGVKLRYKLMRKLERDEP